MDRTTTLMKGFLPDNTRTQLRTMAETSGTTIGQIVEEGVALWMSMRSIPMPKQGVRRLNPGRRPRPVSDDVVVVFMDEDTEILPV